MAPPDTHTDSQPLRVAFEARDFRRVERALSPDVVLHSPITASFSFEGRDQVVALLEIVRDVLGDLHYVHEFGDGQLRGLAFRARVGRQQLEGTELMLLDREGRAAEITVLIRPLAGLTAFAAAVAPRLARQRGRAPALAVAAILRPLALITRLGDAPVSRLVLGRRPRVGSAPGGELRGRLA